MPPSPPEREPGAESARCSRVDGGRHASEGIEAAAGERRTKARLDRNEKRPRQLQAGVVAMSAPAAENGTLTSAAKKWYITATFSSCRACMRSRAAAGARRPTA